MEKTYIPAIKVIELHKGGKAVVSDVTTDVDGGILAADYNDARRSMIKYMMENLNTAFNSGNVKYLAPCYFLVTLDTKVLLYCVEVKEKKR